MHSNWTTKCNLKLQFSFWSAIYIGNSNVVPNKCAIYMHVNDIVRLVHKLRGHNSNYCSLKWSVSLSRRQYGDVTHYLVMFLHAVQFLFTFQKFLTTVYMKLYLHYISWPNRKSLIKANISEDTEKRFRECFWTVVINSLHCQSTHCIVICAHELWRIICCLRYHLSHCASLTWEHAPATSFPILQCFLLHWLQSPVGEKGGKSNFTYPKNYQSSSAT
jgi:hypothetical protein